MKPLNGIAKRKVLLKRRSPRMQDKYKLTPKENIFLAKKMGKWDMQTFAENFTWIKPPKKDWYYWDEGALKFKPGYYHRDRTYDYCSTFLCEREDLTNGISYHPLEDSTLFLRFASIIDWASTSERPNTALLEWVNEYGRLTTFNLKMFSEASVYKQQRMLSLIAQVPETQGFYLSSQSRLRHAVALWEEIATKNKDMLSTRYGMNDEGKKIQEEIRKDLGRTGYEYTNRTEGDVFEMARIDLEQSINIAFEDYPVNLVLEHNRATLVLRPSDLLSCMWYQLALAFKEKIKLRRCTICGQWEDMEGHRENWTKHKQCANNEAVKRYRKKKGIA
jgi:hypothetical protein